MLGGDAGGVEARPGPQRVGEDQLMIDEVECDRDGLVACVEEARRQTC